MVYLQKYPFFHWYPAGLASGILIYPSGLLQNVVKFFGHFLLSATADRPALKGRGLVRPSTVPRIGVLAKISFSSE